MTDHIVPESTSLAVRMRGISRRDEHLADQAMTDKDVQRCLGKDAGALQPPVRIKGAGEAADPGTLDELGRALVLQ